MFIPESREAAHVISTFFDKHLSAAEPVTSNRSPLTSPH